MKVLLTFICTALIPLLWWIMNIVGTKTPASLLAIPMIMCGVAVAFLVANDIIENWKD